MELRVGTICTCSRLSPGMMLRLSNLIAKSVYRLILKVHLFNSHPQSLWLRHASFFRTDVCFGTFYRSPVNECKTFFVKRNSESLFSMQHVIQSRMHSCDVVPLLFLYGFPFQLCASSYFSNHLFGERSDIPFYIHIWYWAAMPFVTWPIPTLSSSGFRWRCIAKLICFDGFRNNIECTCSMFLQWNKRNWIGASINGFQSIQHKHHMIRPHFTDQRKCSTEAFIESPRWVFLLVEYTCTVENFSVLNQ